MYMKRNGSQLINRPIALSCVLVGLFFVSMPVSSAFATPTGLNNIPTADTPPDRTFVFQSFANFGKDRQVDYVAGFKMGLRPWDQRFELGLDGRFGEAEGQQPVLQFKYALQGSEDLPVIAGGVANLAMRSKDRQDVGHVFSFAVLSHDLGWLRGHAGYGFQHNNDAAFFGFDKTVQFLERDLMLRSDFIQIDDQDQWLGSAGVIYFMHENLALESWMSQPLDQGEPFFTLKLNLTVA